MDKWESHQSLEEAALIFVFTCLLILVSPVHPHFSAGTHLPYHMLNYSGPAVFMISVKVHMQMFRFVGMLVIVWINSIVYAITPNILRLPHHLHCFRILVIKGILDTPTEDFLVLFSVTYNLRSFCFWYWTDLLSSINALLYHFDLKFTGCDVLCE